MAADKPAPLPGPARPNWDLPEITGVSIRRTRFRPRKARNFDSPIEAVGNAVEIVVTLDAPLPIRALAPVLHVGEAVLTESEQVDGEGKELRFWALSPATLSDQAPIALGWLGDRSERQPARFAFRRPE
jgi:hypothetical protein